MGSALTILCSEREYRKTVEIVRSTYNDVSLEGAEERWKRITLRSSAGIMTLTSLVRELPGDNFSTLILSIHNFFRTVETDAVSNKHYVLTRLAALEMMIGIVVYPAFSETDERLDSLWKIIEGLDALIFNGDAVLNPQGKRIMSRNGEYDILLEKNEDNRSH